MYNSAHPNVLNKLNSVHNSGIRIATGAYRTSPIYSILTEAQVLPLNLRRKKLSLSYATKIITLPKNQVYPILCKNNKKIYK